MPPSQSGMTAALSNVSRWQSGVDVELVSVDIADNLSGLVCGSVGKRVWVVVAWVQEGYGLICDVLFNRGWEWGLRR